MIQIEKWGNWKNTIKKEFENMEKNDIWDICNKYEKPKNQRLLVLKWVSKIKKNGIFKAKLVAQGFAEIPGMDRQDNFSPVV